MKYRSVDFSPYLDLLRKVRIILGVVISNIKMERRNGEKHIFDPC